MVPALVGPKIEGVLNPAKKRAAYGNWKKLSPVVKTSRHTAKSHAVSRNPNDKWWLDKC
jgi:hypothetical protein